MIALAKSGINIKTFPTFKGLWENTYERGEKRKEKRKIKRGGRRNNFSVSNYHNSVGRQYIVS